MINKNNMKSALESQGSTWDENSNSGSFRSKSGFEVTYDKDKEQWFYRTPNQPEWDTLDTLGEVRELSRSARIREWLN